MIPKVFVGTLYSKEGGFDECTSAIARQKNVFIEHAVIANLAEKEAHNRLWYLWRKLKDDGFDMFVKVDADTVLQHDNVIDEFWKLMSSNPRITGIQAPLFDFFTNSNINGLNCFSPKVTFLDTKDDLYCDRNVDVDHDMLVGSTNVPATLSPAGRHAFNPTEIQAFRYGLHRRLKNQRETIEKLQAAYDAHGTKERYWALLGAWNAAEFIRPLRFRSATADYDNEDFVKFFEGMKQVFFEKSYAAAEEKRGR